MRLGIFVYFAICTLGNGSVFSTACQSQENAFGSSNLFSSFGYAPLTFQIASGGVDQNIIWRVQCQEMATSRNHFAIVYWINGTEINCGSLGYSQSVGQTYGFEAKQLVRLEKYETNCTTISEC